MLHELGSSGLLLELERMVASGSDEPTRRIERALRLGSGWLHAEPDSLPSVLYQQLRAEGVEHAAIRELLPGLDSPVQLRQPVRMESGERNIWRGHSDAVSACSYNADGTRVLTSSYDRTLREWDARTGFPLRLHVGQTQPITWCAYDGSDDSMAWSVASDGSYRVWWLQPHHRGRYGNFWTAACPRSPDRARVLAFHETTLREYDANTGDELRRFEGSSDQILACAYSPDGTRVLASARDGTLREWATPSCELLRSFEGHTASVWSCAYSSDGKHVLSGSDDRTLRVWDADSSRELRRIAQPAQVRACTFSPDGARALSGLSDGTLREWDLSVVDAAQASQGGVANISACALSPDGARVLLAGYDGSLRELDARTRGEVFRFEGHPARSWIASCAYSSDGTRAVSGAADGGWTLWDRATGKAIRSGKHAETVSACVFSPDGSRFLTASYDCKLCQWDARTGEALGSFEGQKGRVTACAYSPDGARVLAAIGDDATLREWDANSYRTRGVFQGHYAWVDTCAYSPDGARIVSSANDGSFREWDARNGSELRWLRGHNGRIRACAYATDTLIVSASTDSTLRFWSSESGECLYTLHGIAAFGCMATFGSQLAAVDALDNVWLLDFEVLASPHRA